MPHGVAGSMGSGYAKLFAAAGHNVTLTYSRDPDKLARAGGPDVASQPDLAAAITDADVVVFSVPWQQVEDVLGKVGTLDGRIVIDAMTPLETDMSGLTVGFTTSGAETLAAKLPGARVVMALQNTFAAVVNAPERDIVGHSPSMFFVGDDPDAKQQVATLIRDAGYEPIDGGPLRNARYLEPLCFFTVQLAYSQGYGDHIGLKLLTESTTACHVRDSDGDHRSNR